MQYSHTGIWRGQLLEVRTQSRSGEFGISNDGFTLVPYTECYWKSSAVNFNWHAFEARDVKWALSKVSRHADRHVLLAHFKETRDMSASLLAAAMEREHSFAYNLLAKLSGTMEEHGLDDVEALVEPVEQTGQIPGNFFAAAVDQTSYQRTAGFSLLSTQCVRMLHIPRFFVWLCS